MTDTTTYSADALRAWAKGSYPLEAGTELLIRTRFAGPGNPWINESTQNPGRWWIDADLINDDTIGSYSGGEQRTLRIAAALLGGQPVNMYEDIPGLDRNHLDLVLAAVAHAGGSHEHSDLVPDPNGRMVTSDGGRMAFHKLGPLHSWPHTGDL